MKWLMEKAVSEVVAPAARRLGGQASAMLVGLGMAGAHQSAVAAAIAWAIISAAELVVSSASRKRFLKKWGKS